MSRADERRDFVAIEPAPGSTLESDALVGVARELAGPAADIVIGWDVPREAGRSRPTVCVGQVATDADAAAAVLAVVGGARVVVLLAAPREVADRLCDDLRRLGSLDHQVGVSGLTSLSDDEYELLSHLLTGMTLGEAAAALHLSRRTADRRLASARRTLGAGSTPEALQAALRRGLRPSVRRYPRHD